jgi:hypothetical protein
MGIGKARRPAAARNLEVGGPVEARESGVSGEAGGPGRRPANDLGGAERCALLACGEPAVEAVAHPYRPEPATPLCGRHARHVRREVLNRGG